MVKDNSSLVLELIIKFLLNLTNQFLNFNNFIYVKTKVFIQIINFLSTFQLTTRLRATEKNEPTLCFAG